MKEARVISYTVKPPNKRPWAFVSIVGLKRTFSPSSSFLRNENRTILSRDLAKNVKNTPTWGLGCREGRLLEGGVYWGFYGIPELIMRPSRSNQWCALRIQICTRIQIQSFLSWIRIQKWIRGRPFFVPCLTKWEGGNAGAMRALVLHWNWIWNQTFP